LYHIGSIFPFFAFLLDFPAIQGTIGNISTPKIMAAKRKIEPVFDKIRNRWKIDVPATLSDSNKRYKAWFKTRDLAREHLAGINGTDEPTAAIAPSLAMEADKARSILEPWNLDLVQVAREVAAALEALGDAGSILEAAKAYRTQHNARNTSKPLGEAVAEYVRLLNKREEENTLRPSTLKSYTYTLEGAFEPLHGKVMAEITAADIESILEGKAPTSRKMHTRNLKAFWKWASKAPRKWASPDELAALETIHTSDDSDISVLKAADVKALMHAAEAEGTGAAAAYAIAVFGGVRMAELSRLTWGNVGEDNIEIGKAVAKKHARRLVPICPTLRAWMDANRGNAADDTAIVPPNWVDVSKSVRRRAGWDVAARLLENPPKPTRGEWPSNACRHTCASVQVAIGTPLDDLTFKFGHSGGHELLKRHYVGRLTKKDALAILAVAPAGVKIPHITAA
jgi:integrase